MSRCTQATATAQFVSTDIQQQRQSRFVNKSSFFVWNLFRGGGIFFSSIEADLISVKKFLTEKLRRNFFTKKYRRRKI